MSVEQAVDPAALVGVTGVVRIGGLGPAAFHLRAFGP